MKVLLPSRARRALLHGTRAPLFHGTRYMGSVLADDEITQNGGVSLTRCPDAAAYWASCGPRPWDDGRGGIVILDGDRLRSDYRLELSDAAPQVRSECEEYTGSIFPLSRYAIGYIWLNQFVPNLGVVEPRHEAGERKRPVPESFRGRLRQELRKLLEGSLDPQRSQDAAQEIQVFLAELSEPAVPELTIIDGRLVDRAPLHPTVAEAA